MTSAIINFVSASYPGLRNALLQASATDAGLDMEDVEEDVVAEQETLIELPTDKDILKEQDLDTVMTQPEPASTSTSGTQASSRSINSPSFTQLQTTLMEASKGVTEGTDAEYKRYVA